MERVFHHQGHKKGRCIHVEDSVMKKSFIPNINAEKIYETRYL